MSTVTPFSVNKTLQEVQDHLEKERKRAENEVASLREQQKHLQEALREIHPAEAKLQPEPETRTLYVSDEKLAAVRDYLAKSGPSRQADLAEVLHLNPGTVSVSLRILEEQGKIKRGEKQAGSTTWATKARRGRPPKAKNNPVPIAA